MSGLACLRVGALRRVDVPKGCVSARRRATANNTPYHDPDWEHIGAGNFPTKTVSRQNYLYVGHREAGSRILI
jgi:hypothetical protein